YGGEEDAENCRARRREHAVEQPATEVRLLAATDVAGARGLLRPPGWRERQDLALWLEGGDEHPVGRDQRSDGGADEQRQDDERAGPQQPPQASSRGPRGPPGRARGRGPRDHQRRSSTRNWKSEKPMMTTVSTYEMAAP